MRNHTDGSISNEIATSYEFSNCYYYTQAYQATQITNFSNSTGLLPTEFFPKLVFSKNQTQCSRS